MVALALGSFDMFHVGHLHALRRGVAESGSLVIGVADDALVLARCGREPRVSQAERVEVLTAFFPDEDIRVVSTDGCELAERVGADTVYVCVPPDDLGDVPSGVGMPTVVALPYHTTDSPSLRSTLESEVLWPLRVPR